MDESSFYRQGNGMGQDSPRKVKDEDGMGGRPGNKKLRLCVLGCLWKCDLCDSGRGGRQREFECSRCDFGIVAFNQHTLRASRGVIVLI